MLRTVNPPAVRLLLAWSVALCGWGAAREPRIGANDDDLREGDASLDRSREGGGLPVRALQGAENIGELGVPFGVEIPKSWAFFPFIRASPLAVGAATLSVDFRPYTALTAAIVIVGPGTVRFPADCLAFALVPFVPGASCSGSGPREVTVGMLDRTFAASTTYRVSLGVVHLAPPSVPELESGQLGSESGVWQLTFAREDGTQLAYAGGVPGYPVWPHALHFERLEFVAYPLGPLIPESQQVLALLFSVPRALGGQGTGVVLRLSAPPGFAFPCDFLETSRAFWLRRSRLNLTAELSVASSSCPRPALEAGGRYAFDVSAVAPGSVGLGAGPGEVAWRTWYLTASEVGEEVVQTNASSGQVGGSGGVSNASELVNTSFADCGGAFVAQFTSRHLEMLLALRSSVLGDSALLWVFVVPSTLLSSPPSKLSGTAWIALHAPPTQGYAFTSTCEVLGGLSSDSAARPLPGGSTCERHSPEIVRINIPHGSQLMPNTPYAFLVQSVVIPTGFGQSGRSLAAQPAGLAAPGASCSLPGLERDGGSCSLPDAGPAEIAEGGGRLREGAPELREDCALEDASSRGLAADTLGFDSSDWGAATFDSNQSLVERFSSAGAQWFQPALLPPLDEFSFSPGFSSGGTRRLGIEYVAAFIFLPPSSLGAPVSFLQITAPSGYSFDPQQDCSPDSVASLSTAEGTGNASEVAAAMRLAIGWCRASPQLPAQQVLGGSLAGGARAEQLPPAGLRSALMALPVALTDFVQRRLFRVKVRHPSRQPTTGERTWSLSLLDSNARLVSQRTGLSAYQLAGTLVASLQPLSNLPSQPLQNGHNIVGVSFRLTSLLPPFGRVVVRLSGGLAAEAFHFPPRNLSSGDPSQAVCDVMVARPAGFADSAAAPLPPPADVTCSNADRVMKLTTGPSELKDGVDYVFWLSVVNPLQRHTDPSSQHWSMWTYGPDGRELDANEEIRTFYLIEGTLPIGVLSTVPADVLSESTASALLFLALPADLPPGSQLRVLAPSAFRLEDGRACRPIADTMPEALFQAATDGWRAGAPTALRSKAVLPLPPGVACTVGEDVGRTSVWLTMSGRLRGGQPYTFAVDVLCPSASPSDEDNRWRLQVWRRAYTRIQWALEGECPGFGLVPKLREARIVPYRSQGDAYSWQSRMLPEAASFVSMRAEFGLPFVPGGLGTSLVVAVETPKAFQVGLDGSSNTTQRSCIMRELVVGREILPVEVWAACAVESANLAMVTVRVPPTSTINAAAVQPSTADDAHLLPLAIEVFPLLPPSSVDTFEDRYWNIRVSTCGATAACSLLAAASDLATWDMFGYLHVDSVVARQIHADDLAMQAPGSWVVGHALWAGARLMVIRFSGVRVSEYLPRGGSLHLTAPCGYEFHRNESNPERFEAASLETANLPPLDIGLCRVAEDASCPAGGQVLVLRFLGALNGDQQYDFELAMRAPGPEALLSGAGADTSTARHWRLTTYGTTGRVLDMQRGAGRWDYTLPFAFAFSAASVVAPPGEFFDLGVFIRMPDIGLSSPSEGGSSTSASSGAPHAARTSLQLLAPAGFEFAPCDGSEGDNARLRAVPPLPSPRDPRVQLALLWPLPDYSACASWGSTLTVTLGGRRRGSGRGALRAGASYAFSWPVRAAAGRQVPRRARPPRGAAGAAVADVLLGDEAASAGSALVLSARWSIAARLGTRRILASGLTGPLELGASGSGSSSSAPAPAAGSLRFEARDVSPVWLLPATPYFGQPSIVFVVFSIGQRAYPPGSRLRFSLHALDAGAGLDVEFLGCRQQDALYHRQAYREPLAYFSHPEEHWSGRDDAVAHEAERSTDIKLLRAPYGSCVAEAWQKQPEPLDTGNNASIREQAPNGQKPILRLTLGLGSALVPPTQQYLLPLVIQHRPYLAANLGRRSVLTLEVLDGTTERALARSHDLAVYPLVRQMTLLHWAYSSKHAAAMNWLDVEFQPATEIGSTRTNPVVLGFALLAPVGFRFLQESCQQLTVRRTRVAFDPVTGKNKTTPLLFNIKQEVSCEVATSPWLATAGYQQHQLTVYMPMLVELSPGVRYHLRAPVTNPPHAFRRAFPADAAPSNSPKFSSSPYLVPVLSLWRLFTFTWPAGDAGGAGAPSDDAVNSMSLGRVGGMQKVDEVAWEGFTILE